MSTVTLEAKGSPTAQLVGSDDQFVTFASGGVAYGVDIMAVREIRSWQPTTPLPHRGPAAMGVLDVRGTVIEVFDLAGLLGGEVREPTAGSVVLVLAVRERLVGIVVDSVSDIIQAPASNLMQVPAAGSGGLSNPVSMMVETTEKLVGILDLEILFPIVSG